MQKLFHETQGTYSSIGVRQHGMARRGVELALEVDKYEMGWVSMSLVWTGWGAELAHGLYALFSLLPCLQKVRNGNYERGCKGKLISKEVESTWLNGGSLT